MSVTDDVYTEILNVFKNTLYPAITYNPTTTLRITGAPVQPASIIVNETAQSFEISRTKREDRLDLSRWMWFVRMKFNQEVDLSNITEALKAVPNPGRIRIMVESCKITHPPRQNPNTGTSVEYVLNAKYRHF